MSEGRLKIVENSGLTYVNLCALFSGDCMGVVVRNFVSKQMCKRVLSIAADHAIEPYDHEEKRGGSTRYVYYGVDRIGIPFNITLGELSGEERERRRKAYYADALAGTRKFRDSGSGAVSPIDLLRLQLDEIWPAGASVAAFEGKKMLCGIMRVMDADKSNLSEENPHFDALSDEICKLNGQYAANVFIETPSVGGAFLIWEADGTKTGAEGIHELACKTPTRVQPEVGDLILFRSHNWHGVERFASGRRISLQCFVGRDGEDRLHLWN